MSSPDVKDIGTFSDPVLVFGGAYGNLQALNALMARARDLGIPPTRMIHTGDVAAYCADTFECASSLKSLGCHAIKGNVEEQLAQNAGDCACGFDEGSECDLLAMRWYALANAQTTPDLRDWMAAMPDHLSFTLQGRRFLVVHGSPRLVNEFVFRSRSDAEFGELFELQPTDCIVAGHTGLPFTRAVGQRVWHNSGALGLPANDGTPRVWFSLISPTPDGIEFSFHALDYEHGEAASRMRVNGLPEGYAAGLENGLWPNTDILPEAETEETGTALAPPSYLWAPIRAAAE